MPTAGTNITKETAVSDFKTTYTDVINGIVGKWTSESNPGGVRPESMLSTATISASGYSPTALASVLLGGQTITTSPVAGQISDVNLVASTVSSLLTNTAITLSRCRLVNLKKYYNSEGTDYLHYDVTNYAHMNSSYQMSIAPPAITGDAHAATFSGVITTLGNAMIAHRDTTLFFTESWCHSSCHTNHDSRSRR